MSIFAQGHAIALQPHALAQLADSLDCATAGFGRNFKRAFALTLFTPRAHTLHDEIVNGRKMSALNLFLHEPLGFLRYADGHALNVAWRGDPVKVVRTIRNYVHD